MKAVCYLLSQIGNQTDKQITPSRQVGRLSDIRETGHGCYSKMQLGRVIEISESVISSPNQTVK